MICLICSKADLSDYESNLFKLCVLDFSSDVVFIQERRQLLEKVTDESYCDEVYSVIHDGSIVFYQENGTPLLRITLNDSYGEAEEQIINEESTLGA